MPLAPTRAARVTLCGSAHLIQRSRFPQRDAVLPTLHRITSRFIVFIRRPRPNEKPSSTVTVREGDFFFHGCDDPPGRPTVMRAKRLPIDIDTSPFFPF